MKIIFRTLGQMLAQVFVFLTFFLMLGGVVIFAQQSVSAAGKFHWVAGVGVGVVWLIGIILLCFAIWYAMSPTAPKWLRDHFVIRKRSGEEAGVAEQFPAATLLALICISILTAVFALTGLSAILASQGMLTYVIESAPEKSMTELLFRLYMWHTIDVIPFIDIWKAYDFHPPIRPENFWAQSIVLVFRTAIVGFAISIIAQSLRFNRENPSSASEAGG